MANQKQFLEVNGVAVIEQQIATANLGNMNGSEGDRPIKTVLELLLEDGTTVYGCNYDLPNARNCEYTKDNVHSVIAHQKIHSAKTKARQNYRNRSAGAVKAAQTRKANRVKTTTTQVPIEDVKSVSLAAVDPTMTMDALALGLQAEATKLRGIATQLDFISRNLPTTTPTPAEPLIDASELGRLKEIEKNYEALKGLLR